MMVPTARTVSPSWADDMWLPLTCMPTTISSGLARIIDPNPATVSANASVAPPCRMPNGWRVRSSTGMVASTRSSDAYVYWMPRFPIRACLARIFNWSSGTSVGRISARIVRSTATATPSSSLVSVVSRSRHRQVATWSRRKRRRRSRSLLPAIRTVWSSARPKCFPCR